MKEFIDINKYLVKEAHKLDVLVEAEVGQLPDSDIATDTISSGRMTDPDEAAYFVEETGVDALAVAVGNVHLLEGKKATLDFDLIKTLRKKVDVPLVLHGGTGISDESFKMAIELGMCKVNVGTILKRSYLNYIRSYLKVNDINKMDPHNVIGRGGDADMLCGARQAVCEEIVRFIKVFGSENKANLI
jgi:fructose/tagatose bisphosphate aldolase